MQLVEWPTLHFGPVNLWTITPAWWFYMSDEDKIQEYIKHYRLYVEEYKDES